MILVPRSSLMNANWVANTPNLLQEGMLCPTIMTHFTDKIYISFYLRTRMSSFTGFSYVIGRYSCPLSSISQSFNNRFLSEFLSLNFSFLKAHGSIM